MITRTASAFVLALSVASAAVADPIQISFDRRINGHASIVDDEGFPSSEFLGQGTNAIGAFDADGSATADTGSASLTVTASQHTFVDQGGHFFGSGSIGVSSAGDFGSIDVSRVESALDANFVLTRPMQFHFSATMAGTDDAIVQAFIEGGPPLDAFGDGSGKPTSIERSGLLAPGSYLFAIVARTQDRPIASASGSFDFDFSLRDVAATPEPGSLALLATGVAGVTFRRRRGRAL